MKRNNVKPLRLSMDAPSDNTVLDQDLLKVHLSIDDSIFDDLLLMYEQVAIQWAEDYMHRSIKSRVHRWVLSDFPYCVDDSIKLPRGLTTSIDSIDYALHGTRNVMRGASSSGSPEGADYQEDLNSDSGGVVKPLYGRGWPSADCEDLSPVIITFTGGWENSVDVPANIKHALMLAISDMFEFRGTADYEKMVSVITAGKAYSTVETLLSSWRLIRVY